MNIFYSEVDKNLLLELDARAAAGTKNRSDRDLNYMLGTSANVEISAFQGENAQTPVIQTLGGYNVRTGRYLPGGPAGYLNETPYEQKSIEYNAMLLSVYTRTLASPAAPEVGQTQCGPSGLFQRRCPQIRI